MPQALLAALIGFLAASVALFGLPPRPPLMVRDKVACAAACGVLLGVAMHCYRRLTTAIAGVVVPSFAATLLDLDAGCLQSTDQLPAFFSTPSLGQKCPL